MTVTAELQFVTDAAAIAAEAAASVLRFKGSLESLSGLSGMRVELGFDISSQLDAAVESAAKISALEAQNAAALGIIEAQGVAKLAAINAQSEARIAEIQAKSAAVLSQAQTARAAADAAAAAQIAQTEAQAAANIATTKAKAEGDIARISAQAQAEYQAHANRVAEQYQKDRNAILLESAKAAHAEQAAEIAHRHRIAELEIKGAQDAAKIRLKGDEDRSKIAAKAAADAQKVAARGGGQGGGKLNFAGAGMALLRGGGLQGAAQALGQGADGEGLTGKAAAYAAAATAIAAVGTAAIVAGKKVAGFALDFGEATLKAQAFKEDLKEAFEVVGGSQAQGDAVFEQALKTADRLGASRQETAAQFLDLATKGFDPKQTDRIVGALRDLSTIDPSASIEGLIKVIGKVQATGRLNQETLNELSTFGLEQSDVIKQIGKILGKNDADVLKALSSSGGIRGLGVEPILNAIQGQVGGGPAGQKAAEKADRNLSSLIERFKQIPENILFDINVGPGIDKVKGILKEVVDYFAAGSEKAERAKVVIAGAFNALVEGLTGTKITDKEGITGSLDALVDGIQAATPVIQAIGSAIRITSVILGSAVAGWGTLLDGSIFTTFGALATGAFDYIIDAASSAGSDIIDGLVIGIESGVQRVVDAASNLGTSAIAAVRSALDSHSPSREMIAVGYDAGAGNAIGYERSTPMVENAARDMALAGMNAATLRDPFPIASPAGAMALAAQTAPPSQQRAPIQVTFSPTIQITVNGTADGAAISDAMRAELVTLMQGEFVAMLQGVSGR